MSSNQLSKLTILLHLVALYILYVESNFFFFFFLQYGPPSKLQVRERKGRRERERWTDRETEKAERGRD